MNSRIAVLQQSVKFFFSILFWLPVFSLSLLIVYNTVPYFSFSFDFPFLRERALLYDNTVWRVSFYVHIFAGMWCISSALLQFTSYILKKRRYIHRLAGKIYVFVVLVLGEPKGYDERQ